LRRRKNKRGSLLKKGDKKRDPAKPPVVKAADQKLKAWVQG